MSQQYINKYFRAFRTKEHAEAVGRQLIENGRTNSFVVRCKEVSPIRICAPLGTEIYLPSSEFYIYYS